VARNVRFDDVLWLSTVQMLCTATLEFHSTTSTSANIKSHSPSPSGQYRQEADQDCFYCFRLSVIPTLTVEAHAKILFSSESLRGCREGRLTCTVGGVIGRNKVQKRQLGQSTSTILL
jgi:hypothetical protein